MEKDLINWQNIIFIYISNIIILQIQKNFMLNVADLEVFNEHPDKNYIQEKIDILSKLYLQYELFVEFDLELFKLLWREKVFPEIQSLEEEKTRESYQKRQKLLQLYEIIFLEFQNVIAPSRSIVEEIKDKVYSVLLTKLI